MKKFLVGTGLALSIVPLTAISAGKTNCDPAVELLAKQSAQEYIQSAEKAVNGIDVKGEIEKAESCFKDIFDKGLLPGFGAFKPKFNLSKLACDLAEEHVEKPVEEIAGDVNEMMDINSKMQKVLDDAMPSSVRKYADVDAKLPTARIGSKPSYSGSSKEAKAQQEYFDKYMKEFESIWGK